MEFSSTFLRFFSKALEASEFEFLVVYTFAELRELYCVFVE